MFLNSNPNGKFIFSEYSALITDAAGNLIMERGLLPHAPRFKFGKDLPLGKSRGEIDYRMVDKLKGTTTIDMTLMNNCRE
jgi:hypothetical protein